MNSIVSLCLQLHFLFFTVLLYYFTTLKLLDYNVVITFRFNNSYNNNKLLCDVYIYIGKVCKCLILTFIVLTLFVGYSVCKETTSSMYKVFFVDL